MIRRESVQSAVIAIGGRTLYLAMLLAMTMTNGVSESGESDQKIAHDIVNILQETDTIRTMVGLFLQRLSALQFLEGLLQMDTN